MAKSPFTPAQRKAVERGIDSADRADYWLQLLRRAGVPNEKLEADLQFQRQVLIEFQKIDQEYQDTH